jgi:DNA replication protein DnaC
MLSRVDLLILDDWGLAPLTGDQVVILLEVVDDRHQRGSTIITSQVPIEHWHEANAAPPSPTPSSTASSTTPTAASGT